MNGSEPANVSTAHPSGIAPNRPSSRNGWRPPRFLIAPDSPPVNLWSYLDADIPAQGVVPTPRRRQVGPWFHCSDAQLVPAPKKSNRSGSAQKATRWSPSLQARLRTIATGPKTQGSAISAADILPPHSAHWPPAQPPALATTLVRAPTGSLSRRNPETSGCGNL